MRFTVYYHNGVAFNVLCYARVKCLKRGVEVQEEASESIPIEMFKGLFVIMIILYWKDSNVLIYIQ